MISSAFLSFTGGLYSKMAVFKPFPAIRPHREYCTRTLCPPYDVVSREEAYDYSLDPANFMRVIRTDSILPEEMEYSKESYELSRSIFDQMLADGVYFIDEKPHYYIYSETFHDHTQTGIAGCASIDDYDNGTIKVHEKTLPEKEEDRIRHFSACNANTEPVFLTYRDNEPIRAMTESIISSEKPSYETTDREGVVHRLWPVMDHAAVKLLEQMFLDIESFYIADGHHRTASAVKVGQIKRENSPGYTGEEEFNRFMAVAFPESQLLVLPYNRILTDFEGLSVSELLDRIGKAADLHPSEDGSAPVKKRHSFKIYLDKKWYTASFHEKLIDEKDPVKSLDVYLLQKHVLDPVFGIRDPKNDPRLSFSGGIDSTEKMVEAVDSGKAAVSIMMYPVTIREIMAVSDSRQTMPPKSTWFEPKIGSGWFIHRMD